MSEENTENVTARVPPSLKTTLVQAAEQSGVSQSDLVRDALRREATRRTNGPCEHALGVARRDREDADAEAERLRERADRRERRARLAVEHLTALADERQADREARADDALEPLESMLADGCRVFAGQGRVGDAADTLGESQEDVIERLKERHPAVPDHAFVSVGFADEPWHGVDADGFLRNGRGGTTDERVPGLAGYDDETATGGDTFLAADD